MYIRQNAAKNKFYEKEFIEKFKSRPNRKGQLKRPDEQWSDNENCPEEEFEVDVNDPA